MFSNLDLALTMLQVTSGLAGLTLVSTGFIPLLAERARGRYAEFVAESRIVSLINLTKLAFGAFSTSVLFSLVWCILLASSIKGWSIVLFGIGCFITFVTGFGLTMYLVLRSLRTELFVER
jgi:hypothetical protein